MYSATRSKYFAAAVTDSAPLPVVFAGLSPLSDLVSRGWGSVVFECAS